MSDTTTAPRAQAPGPQPVNALAAGARLQEFEIRSVIGEGGFGIVYLAFDTLLEREVAIKEYLPVSHATRSADGLVTASSTRRQETFEKGLRCFVSEARMLARFKHPALVEVLRFWEENGTAYMVMPYYRGRPLSQLIREGFRIGDTDTMLAFLSPLLDGLSILHAAHCYHRDISTDNILILDDGSPLLLDFGAARSILVDKSDVSTVILKPGFAPIEQYSEDRSVAPQGAWTDLYALSAVAYQVVTGVMPVVSVARIIRDPLTPLVNVAPEGLSRALRAAIDAGLCVKPDQRPQSVAAFLALIQEEGSAAVPPSADPVAQPAAAAGQVPAETAVASAADDPLAIVAGAPFAPVDLTADVDLASSAEAVPPAPAPAPASTSWHARPDASPGTPHQAPRPGLSTQQDEATAAHEDERMAERGQPPKRIDGMATPAGKRTLRGWRAAALVGVPVLLVIGLLAGGLVGTSDDVVAQGEGADSVPAESSVRSGAALPFALSARDAENAPATVAEPQEARQPAVAPLASSGASGEGRETPPADPASDSPAGVAGAPLAAIPVAEAASAVPAEALMPPPSAASTAPESPMAVIDVADQTVRQPTDVPAEPPRGSVGETIAPGTPPARTAAETGEAARTPAAQQKGVIEVRVEPWGNVFANGELKGVAPPRVRFQVEPGTTVVEIRNETHPPKQITVNVEAGRTHRIKHVFGAD